MTRRCVRPPSFVVGSFLVSSFLVGLCPGCEASRVSAPTSNDRQDATGDAGKTHRDGDASLGSDDGDSSYADDKTDARGDGGSDPALASPADGGRGAEWGHVKDAGITNDKAGWQALSDAGDLSQPLGFAFTDVTKPAGLERVQWNPPENFTESPCQTPLLHSGGAAAADVDGDGLTDLFVSRFQLANSLYHNQGDGTFVDIAPAAGLDLALWSNSPSFGDVDGDGDLDLFITVSGPGMAMLFINQGDGTFIEEAARRGLEIGRLEGCSEVTSATFADYDHDSDLDLHVTHWTVNSVEPPLDLNRLLQNDGTGHFTDVTEAAGVTAVEPRGYSSAFMDADGDGWEDLFLVSDFRTSRLFHNNQDGTFEDVTEPAGVGIDENGMGNALGDINNDGFPDWFVTSIYKPSVLLEGRPTGNRLYINRGDGRFSDRSESYGITEGGWGWGAILADFDNDGWLDASHVNGWQLDREPEASRLWLGGTPPWREVAQEAGLTDTREGRAYIPLDFDRDGDVDSFIVNNGDTPQLNRNELNTRAHWLVVKARGTRSNSQSIGARVEVQDSKGNSQYRWITANSTFLGHGPFEAHFGLGADEGPLRVRVSWPASGKKYLVSGIAPDQVLIVDEP